MTKHRKDFCKLSMKLYQIVMKRKKTQKRTWKSWKKKNVNLEYFMMMRMTTCSILKTGKLLNMIGPNWTNLSAKHLKIQIFLVTSQVTIVTSITLRRQTRYFSLSDRSSSLGNIRDAFIRLRSSWSLKKLFLLGTIYKTHKKSTKLCLRVWRPGRKYWLIE